MRLSPYPWFPIAIVLMACGPGPDNSATADYELVTDVQGIMFDVLEPAAETYWDAVGWILDFDGVHHFRPETEEEWAAVRHSAFVVAEAGNLLMMEGRAIDQDAWIGFSRSLVEVGKVAIEAAEAQDTDAVFDAGAEVYAVCSACHAAYALETLRPNDERADALRVDDPVGDTSGDADGDSDGSGG